MATTPTFDIVSALVTARETSLALAEEAQGLADSRDVWKSLCDGAYAAARTLQSSLDDAASHLADVVEERDTVTLERDAARQRRDYWCREAADLADRLEAVTKGRDILAAVLLSDTVTPPTRNTVYVVNPW